MNTNDMISKIKEVLNLSEEVKLEQMPLENGTVLEAESFEAGNEVFIVTEDEKVAVPVGEYELEDGRILVVAEEGLIAEIKAEEEEVEVEAKEEEKEEMKYATKEELAEVKSMIEEIKAMLEPKEEMSEEPKEELSAVELSEVPVDVQEELDKPAAEPIKANPEKKQTLSKFNIASNRPMSTLDKIMAKLSN
jgi:outer membrane biosynthesis protein TonB